MTLPAELSDLQSTHFPDDNSKTALIPNFDTNVDPIELSNRLKMLYINGGSDVDNLITYVSTALSKVLFQFMKRLSKK